MSQAIIEQVEKAQLKTDQAKISVGDTVDVHYRIIEGEKERIQVFNGVIMRIQGAGMNQTMLIRRIVANEGVERVIPVHSPKIAKIDVIRHGDARRARLYFLRDRVGKKRRLRDKRRGMGNIAKPQADGANAPAEAATESAES